MLKNLKFLILIYFLSTSCNHLEKEISLTPPDGMVWVEGKSYTKGAKIDDQYSMMRENPSHVFLLCVHSIYIFVKNLK